MAGCVLGDVGSIHGLDLLAGPLQVVLPHNHTPSDAWRPGVLPADAADMQRAALTCSILANLAVRSDAWPASRHTSVGLVCCTEWKSQEERFVLVVSRGQRARTLQSALHRREKETLLC